MIGRVKRELIVVDIENLPKQKYIQKSIELIRQDRYLSKYTWEAEQQQVFMKHEADLGVRLPLAFKEYFLALGNIDEQMIFGRDSEMELLTDLLEPEPWETDEMSEYLAFVAKLKEYPAFCFSSHEGYYFDWFYLIPGDEDPICYSTNDLEEINCQGRFSSYLLESLKEHSSLLEQLAL